jgi:hypothetical protein
MKRYEVLTDTWLRGRPYASGSTAILGDADEYVRAGLIRAEGEPAEEVPEPEEKPKEKPRGLAKTRGNG